MAIGEHVSGLWVAVEPATAQSWPAAVLQLEQMSILTAVVPVAVCWSVLLLIDPVYAVARVHQLHLQVLADFDWRLAGATCPLSIAQMTASQRCS